MPELTFCGPYAQVFPHLQALDGAGTFVAVPGQAYDFPGAPPGPAGWWKAGSTPEWQPPEPPGAPPDAPPEPPEVPPAEAGTADPAEPQEG